MTHERIVVTGGAGFVGSHLCHALVTAGHDVVVIDNLSRGSRAWLPTGVDLVELDIREREAVRLAVVAAQPNAIVHLAALHFIPAVDGSPDLARSINVDGTASVLAAAEAARPSVLVFASTAAVYPDFPGAIDESLDPDPIDLYGRTKLAGERLVAETGLRSGIRCVSARLFNVIGPHETNPHVIPEIIEQLRAGSSELSLGNLEPRRDYIDARDVASGLSTLLENATDVHRAFNVGTGRATSVAEVVATCEAIIGRAITVRPDPQRTRRVDRQSLLADAGALRRLGWIPRHTLESTLRELLIAPLDVRP